jgi:hypothetical protein
MSLFVAVASATSHLCPRGLDFQPISARMMIRSGWPAGLAMLVPRVDARRFPVPSCCHRSLTPCILALNLVGLDLTSPRSLLE